MKVVHTEISDLLILEPTVYGDERGFFFESFNDKAFRDATNCTKTFVQDNHSKSKKNVLRGLHLQTPPFEQGKLVRCVSGEVYDVGVDLRQGSKTFGKWVGVFLSEKNHRQLWIPPGFAHGFLVMSDDAEFLYKTTNYYAPDSEASIKWDDVTLNIDWPIERSKAILSDKDKMAKSFEYYVENMQ